MGVVVQVLHTFFPLWVYCYLNAVVALCAAWLLVTIAMEKIILLGHLKFIARLTSSNMQAVMHQTVASSHC